MSGIGNGNDNPALRQLDAIGTARSAYHHVQWDAEIGADEDEG